MIETRATRVLYLISPLVFSILGDAALAGDGVVLAGSWSGTMDRIDASGRQVVRMEVTLSGRDGTTNYPDLDCRGKLSRSDDSGSAGIYTETITYGRTGPESPATCTDGTVIIIGAPGDKIGLIWSGVGRPFASTATLRRKK